MTKNPIRKERKVPKQKRFLSGVTAGLMALSSVAGSLPNVVAAENTDGKVDLGTFTYATELELGSANKYAVFSYAYYQTNHMEGIFACENFHPKGHAFGSTGNVTAYIDGEENQIYIGGSIGTADDEVLADEITMITTTNGLGKDDPLLWKMIIPDDLYVDRTVNNGNGIRLVYKDSEGEETYSTGAFNEVENLAKEVYHVSDVTYNIDFIPALMALNDYQNYWAEQNTEEEGTIVTKPDEDVDQNLRVIQVDCAAGGNVITLTAEELKTSSLHVFGPEGGEEYSLIVNVTGLTDGDYFDREAQVDGKPLAGYGPEAGKLMFNMLGSDGDTYTFNKLDGGVILAPLCEIKIDSMSHNGSVMAFIVENMHAQIHQNGFRQLGIDHTPVTFTKSAVTGEQEIGGAKLELYRYNYEGEEKLVTEWESVAGKSKTIELADGEYVLIEGESENADFNDGYSVLPSAYEFTIENGEITAVSQTENVNGYVTFNSTNNTIVVNDAAKTPVSISKTDITGKKEVEGAKLTVRKVGVDENGKTIDELIATWESLLTEKDSDGSIIKSNEKTLFLENGTYVLKEEPSDNEAFSSKYEIVTSEVKFTVENGRVVDVEGGDDVYTSVQANREHSYFIADAENKKITVCDATTEELVKVTISKKDITGENEVKGAILTLYNPDGSVKESHVSGTGKEPWEVELSDGVYKLTETGDFVYDETTGTKYKVIDNGVTFEVKDGKVVSKNEVDRSKGGVIADERTSTVKICDAEAEYVDVELSKSNINGDEIPGARLTFYEAEDYENNGTDAKVVATWVSGTSEKNTVKLYDGKYVMVETNADDENKPFITVQGVDYKIIESAVEFTVAGGAVVRTDDKPIANGNVEIGGTSIKIQDAERDGFSLSKTDINGKGEIAGAQIEIFEAENGQPVGRAIVSKVSGESNFNEKFYLEDGDYVLRETAADKDSKYIKGPDGAEYEILDSDFTFTVRDGKIVGQKELTEDEKFAATVEVKGDVIVISDAKRAEITLSKRDINTKEEIKGATLTVYDKDGNVVETWDSDGVDTHTFKLDNGKYTLKETATEDGNYIIGEDGQQYFVVGSEFEFTVEDGKITDSKPVNESGIGTIKADGNTITVSDAARNGITLSKTDIRGEAEVAGAKLDIYKVENGTVSAKPVVTKISGEDNFDDKIFLDDGEYVLRESAAEGTKFIEGPNGVNYEIIDSEFAFTVENGKVVRSEAVESTQGTISANDAGDAIEICDAKTAKIKLSKTAIRPDGAEEIKGATLTIYDEDGNVVESWDSDGENAGEVELPNGNYTLRETATEGGDYITDDEGNQYYVIDSEFGFTVENGEVVRSEEVNDKEGTITAEGNTITVNDAAREGFKLSKTVVRPDGAEEIEGATLTIYDEDGKVVKTWDSNGKTSEEFYLDDGKYTLKETATKEAGSTAEKKYITVDGVDYYVIDSEFTFEVKDNEIISSNEVDTYQGTVKAEGNVIKVTDAETIKIKLSKTDINGDTEIVGATLTIKDSEGKVVKTWLSGTETNTVVLDDGDYTLEETATKMDGTTEKKDYIEFGGKQYYVVDSTFKFTVKDGKVASSEKVESYKGTIEADETAIKVCDAETSKIYLSKTAVNGEDELKGATLTIKDSEGNVVKTWESDGKNKGEVVLEDGEYTLEETATEAGKYIEYDGKKYYVVDSAFKFTVENGKVVSSEKVESFKGEITATENTIKVSDAEVVKIKLSKTAIRDDGDEEIAGATLTIKNSEGKVVETWNSDGKNKGEVVLEDGDYTLEETATSGDTYIEVDGQKYYVVDSTFEFTVKDGKVTSSNEVDTYKGTVTATEDSITVNDAAVRTIKLSKRDITNEQEVAGATITITNKETGEIITWNSEDGDNNEFILADGEYTLTETATKPGEFIEANGKKYRIVESVFSFRVQDGQIPGSKSTSNYLNGTVTTDKDSIVIDDRIATEVTLSKVALTDGKPEVNGAKIEISKIITGKTTTEEVVKTWVSGKDEKTFVLDDGDYVLREAPSEDGEMFFEAEDGNLYMITESEFKFRVENGSVVPFDDTYEVSDDKGSIEANGNTITISDGIYVKDADDSSVPDSSESSAPESSAPESSAPESSAPESSAPESSAPESSAPESSAPESSAPESSAPESSAPESSAPESSAPESSAPESSETPDDSSKTEQPGDDSSRIPDTDSSKQDDDTDSSSSRPIFDESSTPDTTTSGDDSSRTITGDSSVGDNTTNSGDSSDSSDSSSSSSSSSGSSSGSDTSSSSSGSSSSGSSSSNSSKNSSTATSSKPSTNNDDNPHTGSGILVNGLEFAIAVGLCFAAVNAKKKREQEEE